MNEKLNNLILKINQLNISVKNYKDILSLCLGKSKTIQDAFIEYLGDNVNKNFDVDVQNGKLYLGDKDFQIEYIGTASDTDNTWLWADCNSSLPIEHKNIIKQLYNIGKYFNINEFINNKIDINNYVNPYNLASTSSILLGKNLCFYNAKSDGTTLSMFVKGLDESIFKPVDIIKFNSVVLDCLSNNSLNDILFFFGFLILNDCEVLINRKDNHINCITGVWTNGSNYTAFFDKNQKFLKSAIKVLNDN